MATCQAFALCCNPATMLYESPVIGLVPSCKRCADKLHRLGAGTDNSHEKDA